jgi:preprotein translocase subunit SecA
MLKLQPERRPQRVKTVFDTSAQQMVHPQAQKFETPQAPSESLSGGEQPRAQAKTPAAASHPRVGRNDPCPCGSGKKYKKCCGQ